MRKRNYMKEISDIFQVPPSTLRYWENECLIKFSRDEENNYRLLSFHTMLDIWNIAFYRDLSIPLKEIKLIPFMNIDELESTLTKNKEKLVDEFYKLKKTIEKIESKEKIINRFKYLQSNPCYTENRIFSAIRVFDYPKNYLNKEMIQLYLSHPNEGLIVIDSEKSLIDYGYFTCETDNDIFREKDDCEKLYLVALLKVESDNILNSNYSELVSNAEKLGYKTGIIIGKYLITACDDKQYDYYEAWIELL